MLIKMPLLQTSQTWYVESDCDNIVSATGWKSTDYPPVYWHEEKISNEEFLSRLSKSCIRKHYPNQPKFLPFGYNLKQFRSELCHFYNREIPEKKTCWCTII